MDLSILAAVGSFMVSERLLPPKFVIITCMGMILVYDLMTKTHDPASLLMYRGPGLVAFTLLCSACCLRIWRRNGIACDELIFLPGTIYGEKQVTSDKKAGALSIFGRETDADKMMECAEKSDSVCVSLPDLQTLECKVDSTLEDKDEIDSGVTPSENGAILRMVSSDESENENDNSHDSDDDEEHYAYAPSAPTVFGASLDLFFPVLMNFHLFTLASNRSEDSLDFIDPRLLPMTYATILYVRSMVPWKRRHRFWGTIRYTLMAPFYTVSFRDDFIGDILTSLIRVFQDVAFSIFYYFTILKAFLVSSEGLAQANAMLEDSWTFHKFIIPIIAIAPLWWKFLQSLRRMYDTKLRWPHMGNAFKYLSAALIVLHALSHNDRGSTWILLFLLATLFQIFWDTVVDWELLVLAPLSIAHRELSSPHFDNFTIDSMAPTSCCVPIYHRIVQPILNIRWNIYTKCWGHYQIALRPNRKFNDSFYWKIFWFNACFRVCWMLSMIPTHANVDANLPFTLDVTYMRITITMLEIVRRCLWSILKVECESIKLTNPEYATSNDQIWQLSNIFKNQVFDRCECYSDPKSEQEYEPLPMAASPDEEMGSSHKLRRRTSLLNQLLLLEIMLWICLGVGLGFKVVTS